MTMSVLSMSAMARCTGIGTPLASVSGPVASPTISTWKGARTESLGVPISERAFITS